MRILVMGGTGTTGSAVVRELLARGARVEVLTRDAAKAATLPQGARAVTGDVLEPHTVRTVFRGADGVFLLNPVSTTEAHEGLMALNGIRLAGVGRVVYLSVHEVDRAPHLPHFGSKIAVETALRAAGIPCTILRPNNFYQNDYWFQQAMLEHGVYPQPIGSKGISRVDVRDIGEAAAIALTEDGHAGETYDLVGPEVLTGNRTAEIWSEALGREVRYGGEDMDAWEQQSLAYLPAWMVFDFRLMYEHFQREGLAATEEAIERQTRMLGHPPRSFGDFTRETARSWRS
jgi:uncharacterized protein YbjT (DUF2867 family)